MDCFFKAVKDREGDTYYTVSFGGKIMIHILKVILADPLIITKLPFSINEDDIRSYTRPRLYHEDYFMEITVPFRMLETLMGVGTKHEPKWWRGEPIAELKEV